MLETFCLGRLPPSCVTLSSSSSMRTSLLLALGPSSLKRVFDDKIFTLLPKKPNVVTHILQSRDPNLPGVIKHEPTDIKLFINYENESTPVIKKEKENDISRPVSKTDLPSPQKKSLVVKPSSQDKRVLRSLCKNNTGR